MYKRSPVTFVFYLAQALRKERVVHSGKTVNVYYEVVDTHERKVLLGETARHLILRKRVVAEPGACESSNTTERDGWYIEEPAGKGTSGYIVMLQSGAQCEDNVVLHGKPGSPGFPVIEHSNHMTREMLELSKAPLDGSLFEIPAGFKRIEMEGPNWFQQFSADCGQLDMAVRLWFE